jgi:prevent-host-death family protein
MKTVPVYEAKNRFSELLAAVEQGETVSITRRGAPVARLIAEPAAGKTGRNEARKRVAAGFERLRVLRAGISLDGDLKTIAREGAD